MKIASAEGLIWKIWTLQQEELEIGGIYLFETRDAARAFLQHPSTQALRENPVVISLEAQMWEVESSLSQITRAPLNPVRLGLSEVLASIAGGR